MPTLSKFEGRDVLRSLISVTNAGDGLSAAMKVEPTEIHHGDRVYLLIEAECAKVRFDPATDDDKGPLNRLQVLRAGTATIVDRDFAIEHINAQAEKIKLAAEAEAGVQRLDLDGAPDGGDDPTPVAESVPGAVQSIGSARSARAKAEAENDPPEFAAWSKRLTRNEMLTKIDDVDRVAQLLEDSADKPTVAAVLYRQTFGVIPGAPDEDGAS